MQKFQQYLSFLTLKISRVVMWFAALGIIVMTLIIAWQVFGRYVLNSSPTWTEQLALVLMLYYILLAAAIGVREQFHLGLYFLRDRLPDGLKKPLLVLAHSLVGFFGIVMCWEGAFLTAYTWSHVIPALGIPQGVSYIPFSVAGALIALFSLEHLLDTLTDHEQEQAWN